MNDRAKKITKKSDSHLNVPDFPIVPYIEGDGIGPDIWKAARKVIDAAVEKTSGRRKIEWLEIYAGEKSYHRTGEWLPEKTLETMKDHIVSIKGPMTTPVGGGIRSLNVAIRHRLNLYACIRPIRYIDSVPSPMKHPEKVNVVVFRENMEDVYAGIEWESGSEDASRVISFLKEKMGVSIPADAGVGIKPISERASKKLVAAAISYAIENQKPSVTLMHKGNIMKFTEAAFRKWGYEVAKERFSDKTVTEQELYDTYHGKRPEGKVVIKDRIADVMFQFVLLRPDEFDVIATPNLNGDYISDALAAQVGGLGMAPGANIGDDCAVFEATHGTAPKYAGLDKVNPSSLILSGAMMLEYMGWKDASGSIWNAVGKTIKAGFVTYDLARQISDAREVSCSGFAERIVENIG
ncbi:MAG: isocitrate dehydrogenase (NADP(+)) [Desulfobacteraceae bacterium]|nr:MAG: isocitrate dehydrogenase (NADP(+)) [Desulfobacteraceae bacterium]